MDALTEKVIDIFNLDEPLKLALNLNTWMESLPYLQWYFKFNGADYLYGGIQVPVIASILYVICVFVGKAMMSSSRPWTGTLLKYSIGAHNLFLCLLSIAMFSFTMGHMVWYFIIWRFSLHKIMCDSECNILEGPIAFWVYVFLLSKYYEFLDTFFIVIKKHKLIFLHWYHHILTLLITWAGIKYGVGFQYMALITNTFVHIMMYWYFFLTSQGVKGIWWKPYLTIMQMIQFGMNGCGITLWYYWHYRDGCCGDDLTVFWVLFANITFLILFFNNFVHSYCPQYLPKFLQDAKPEKHAGDKTSGENAKGAAPKGGKSPSRNAKKTD